MKQCRTKDFYFASLLFYEGFQLVDSTKEENTVFFIFDNNDDEKLSRLFTDFINMTVFVNLKKFVIAIQTIRNELQKYK